MATEFGDALRQCRRNAGVSQRKLAELANLDFSYISKLENGRIPPPAANTLVLICKILNIAPETLLALTGKLPSEVQENVSTSRSAQMFLREAQQMNLTDEEWDRITNSLKELRDR
jgi:transcriptional regulator with XRE-family HTH domain